MNDDLKIKSGKHDKKVAYTEFIHTYHKINVNIYALIRREFGVKILKYFTDDELSIENEKFILNKIKSKIIDATENIGIYIELANSIFITNENEYLQRRNNWNLAIGWCNTLKCMLQTLPRNYPGISIGQFEQLAILIDKEVNLIKGIKSHDNKLHQKM